LKIEELRGMTDEELIRQHNMIQGDDAGIPGNLFLDELNRRDLMQQGERMEKLTTSINLLTLVITIVTVIALCGTVYPLIS